MFEKLKKHSVKILVFVINILLAAIAVFIIREEDQTRLLEKAQEEKKNLESENVKNEALPSFENSISVEEQKEAGGTAVDPSLKNVSGQNQAAGATNAKPSSTSTSNSASSKSNSSSSSNKSSGSAPSSSSQKSSSSSSNAKTKTS